MSGRVTLPERPVSSALRTWLQCQAASREAREALDGYTGKPGDRTHRVLATRYARRKRRELDAREVVLAAERNDA